MAEDCIAVSHNIVVVADIRIVAVVVANNIAVVGDCRRLVVALELVVGNIAVGNVGVVLAEHEPQEMDKVTHMEEALLS